MSLQHRFSPNPSVLTYGEALLKLALPAGQRLESLTSLEAQCAGSELNVAAALTTLGTPTAWISALPESPLGTWVHKHVEGLGVQNLALKKSGRLGSFYLEDHHVPRPSRVVYDRSGTAFSTLTETDFDQTWLTARTLVHLSGISLALGQGPRALALRLLQEAKAAGLWVSFDVNHRRLLLTEATAQQAYAPALELADLIFVAERDVGLFGGVAGLRLLNPSAHLLLTRGAAGSEWHTPDGQQFRQAAITAAGPGRVGRGDAFAGALLHAFLRGKTPENALGFATAAAALKTTMLGDQLYANEQEVQMVCEAANDLGEPLR